MTCRHASLAEPSLLLYTFLHVRSTIVLIHSSACSCVPSELQTFKFALKCWPTFPRQNFISVISLHLFAAGGLFSPAKWLMVQWSQITMVLFRTPANEAGLCMLISRTNRCWAVAPLSDLRGLVCCRPAQHLKAVDIHYLFATLAWPLAATWAVKREHTVCW